MPATNPKILCLTFLATSLALTVGAGSSSAQEAPSKAGAVQMNSGSCATAPSMDRPFEQVQLANGSMLQFFADEDGSVAVAEQGRAGATPVLTHPDLRDGTVADIYWAVTRGERAVPESLMENHRLEAAQPWAGLGDGRQRGWWLDDPPQVATKAGECVTGVQDFVCNTNAASYPSGPGCFNNSYGSLSWTNGSGAVRRYRTGVCSYGTFDAYMTWHYNGPSGCDYFRPLNFMLWGRYTNYYYFYAWSGPSGAAPRSYDNSVTHVSGSPFDWGVRFKIHTGSSCTI